MVSRRVRNIGFSPTLAVNELAGKLRAEGHDVLDFSAGQPDFPTPEAVKDAGKRAVDENKTRYTPTAGIPDLREAIAEMLNRDRGLDCSADRIIVSPGAKASLYFAFSALLDAGDEVVVPAPYWTSYPEQIRLADAEPVFVACDESDGFKLTPDRLERSITSRTKALILNYPNNPTGACYTAEELRALAEVCVRRDVWVVADEIYSYLLYGGRPFASIASCGPEIAARTVVIDGMSKTYAMTGWRLGYAAGPAEVIAGMAKLQSHSTSNATSISQWAGLEALRLPPEVLAPRLGEFERRRDEVVAGLRAIRGLDCTMPEGAFYAFPNVSRLFDGEVQSGEAVSRVLLERARVAVVPGEAFGSSDHIRLSYAVSLEQLREGLTRIAEAVGLR